MTDMTTAYFFNEMFQQGEYRAAVTATSEEGPFVVSLHGPGVQETQPFITAEGATGYARARLQELEPDGDMIPVSDIGSSVHDMVELEVRENPRFHRSRRMGTYSSLVDQVVQEDAEGRNFLPEGVRATPGRHKYGPRMGARRPSASKGEQHMRLNPESGIGTVATNEYELWAPARAQNPKSPEGLACFAIKSENRKTGLCSTTYAANPSCPNGSNSTRPCPFLGSGCYAEARPGAIVLARINRASGGKLSSTTTPEQIARDEAASILLGIEEIKKKGSQFRPLRLHVVGDCVNAASASILADACAKWPAPVWTYTHAWRDVPRSAWGDKISVLASCETMEGIKEAMGKGYAAAVVTVNKEFANPEPRKDAQAGVQWIPCPNEAKTGDIKCGPNPDPKAKGDPRIKNGCRLCWNAGGLLSKRSVIVFTPHGNGSAAIISAINRLDGTKVKV